MCDFVLNDKLFDYVIGVLKMMIENAIEETPNEMTTFISINNMLNELGEELKGTSIDEMFYEEVTDKLFAEIKNCL